MKCEPMSISFPALPVTATLPALALVSMVLSAPVPLKVLRAMLLST